MFCETKQDRIIKSKQKQLFIMFLGIPVQINIYKLHYLSNLKYDLYLMFKLPSIYALIRDF